MCKVMLKENRQVLLVINDAELCKKVEESIQGKFGFEVEIATDGENALALIEDSPWQYDVTVIYDDLKKDSKSLDVLREIKRIHPEIEVIFVINSEKKDKADEWREGAFNCFFHPINYESIAYGVKIARDQAQFRRERKMLGKFQQLSGAISSATELQEIQNLACHAAAEIFNADHSGLVEFEKDLSKGKVIAEYPGPQRFVGTEIEVRGIPLEENLVNKQEIINVSKLIECVALGEAQKKLLALKIRSLLIVPVVLKKKVIASISLDMTRKNRVFYQDEIELFRKLADQVAVAIGKARYLKELSVLNKIARDIGTTDPVSLNITEMLGKVRQHASKLLDVTNFYIALYDEEKEEYSFPYHDSVKEKVDSVPKEKMRKGLTEYVRNTKKPILVDKKVDQQLTEEGKIELVGEPSSIWLGAPLIARGKVLGVMVVQDYHNEKAYDEHDLDVLETIATQTAIAIDNAKLFRDAQSRIRDQEILNNIVQTISTKLDTRDLFRTMVIQIAEKLNCSHCTIFLSEKKKEEKKLVPQISHGKFSKQVMSRTFNLDEGLAGWVFQHGESIITPDARNDTRYAKARHRLKKPRSMLVAPVKVGNRTIGVISADQDEKNWFHESDRQLVDTLAQHAGIAIERALGLNLLTEVGLQLISSEDENKILQRVVAGAIELTNTITGMLYLISEDGKSITKRFPYPSDFDPPHPRMDEKNGFTRQIIDIGKIIIVPDLLKDSRVNRWLLQEGFRSMIGIPLQIGEKVVGVLYLNSNESRPFSETECSLLEILASQAAIAIHNSRLYRESQRQLTEIDTLYEISKEIAAKTMNLRSVLDTILIKALELSNADSAQILFLDEVSDEERKQIKVASTHGLPTLKGLVLKYGEGLAWKVFESGKSIYTGDYHREPDRARILDEPGYKNLYKSLAIVPLKWRGKLLGAISVTSIKSNHFTKNDIRLLERFLGTASIVIATANEISFRQTLLNNSPDAIVAIDRKGIVKEFNKAAEKIFDCTAEDVLDESVIDLWGGISEAKWIKQQIYKNNGRVRRIETYVRNEKGEKIPVLFSGSILYAEGYGEDIEEIGSIGQIEDQRIVFLEGKTGKLFKIIEEINCNEELSEIIKTVLYSAINLLEADSGYIILKQNDFFRIVESFNVQEQQAERIGFTIKEELIKIINGGILKTFSLSSFPESDISISNEGRSGLVLPLKIEDKIMGALYLESHVNDFFHEENELLQILSTEAAVAINRAQLKEESKELQLLKEIGDEIRVKGRFEEYKDIIVKTSQELLRSEISTIFLYDKSSRHLCRKAWYPKIEELEDFEESYSIENGMRGITGRVLECQESVNTHIIYAHEDEILKEALPQHIEKYKNLPSWKKKKNQFAKSPIRDYLAIPIFGEKGKVFGALRVMNKVSKEYNEENPILDEHGFREPEDVKLLKTIASLLSQALSSERKAKKLRMLHEITDEISEKTDKKGIGDCLVQAVVNRLGYSACSMRLVKGDELELISHDGFRSKEINNIIIPKDRGLVGEAIKRNKAVIVYDISSNEKLLYKDYAEKEDIRSICCIPIKSTKEEEAMGVIVVYMRDAPYYFEDYEIKDNLLLISATCSIALRKVQAKEHLQKLIDLLELVHVAASKEDIFKDCIKEMLPIFDADAAIVYETKKTTGIYKSSSAEFSLQSISSKNIENKLSLSMGLVKQGELQMLNANEFPDEWDSIKKEFGQAVLFTLDFQEEILGAVALFSKKNSPLSLPESDRKKLALAISRQLAIAFKNIEISNEIEKRRLAEPAIISAQYVSGMIHELASIAQKGKGAATYIRGSEEFRNINNRNCKVEMSKIESSFDDIGVFTDKALKIKDMGEMRFERTLEYGSINKVVLDVLNDSSSEIRKKVPKIKTNFDKKLNPRHAFFDEILIKQAIRNLIYNSIRWLSKDGYIKISTSQKGDYIFITVEDNGHGVKPGTEEFVFDPYFSTAPDGHGIGLFFVRSVARMHKGDARLVSPRNRTILEIKISSKLRKGG